LEGKEFVRRVKKGADLSREGASLGRIGMQEKRKRGKKRRDR